MAQLVTGAWSDRVGRKWLIAGGMWVQAVGIAVIVLSGGFAGFATGAAILGVGTAMVYPTLLAAIGDVAHPSWRASSVGVYRLWRDLGYAVGAVLAGLTADALGLSAAMWFVAGLTFASGVVVAARMTETHRARTTPVPAATCVEPGELPGITNALVVDVRSPEEFAAGHIDGAINIPLDRIAAGATALPRDAAVVTVCGKGGGRSERAAEELRALGFRSARSLCGGTQAWLQLAARGA
jgi:rhodanese-related sulfurtransferase